MDRQVEVFCDDLVRFWGRVGQEAGYLMILGKSKHETFSADEHGRVGRSETSKASTNQVDSCGSHSTLWLVEVTEWAGVDSVRDLLDEAVVVDRSSVKPRGSSRLEPAETKVERTKSA